MTPRHAEQTILSAHPQVLETPNGVPHLGHNTHNCSGCFSGAASGKALGGERRALGGQPHRDAAGSNLGS